MKLSFIPNKIAIWFCVFVSGVLFFTLFRLIFLLTHSDLIGKSPYSEILQSFIIGFRFDSVILSVVILPLMLISLLPFIKFKTGITRKIYTIILTMIFSLSFFISTADLRFFDNFGSRMNYWAIEYLEYPGIFLYTSASQRNAWELVFLWLVTSVLYFYVIRKIFLKLADFNLSVGLLSKTIMYILAAALLAFGIRGRVGIKPLDWGTAFFSENHFIDQLALNSVYTLTHSIYEEMKNGRTIFGEGGSRFSFCDNKEAFRSLADMLDLKYTDSTNNFTLDRISYSENQREFLPNIVFVIMESWSADKIGALGSDLNITPRFDELCAQGILFDNFYANGARTNRGIPAALCSFPSLPGRSIMKRYAADYPFRSIADILNDFNYTSIFAYGGDIEFDNMRGFLKSVGYDRFYDENSFGNDNRFGKWGVPDHIVFDQLVENIKTFRRPFNLTVLTLSNHDPYLIPDDRFKLYSDSIPDSEVYNCFYYSDDAIGRFIDSLKEYPVFDSTIFVFTADHCTHQSSQYLLNPERFRVPLLIYAPSFLKNEIGIINKTGSQVDILPTLLGILGMETKHSSWGRDLLSLGESDSGFAVIVLDEKLGLVEGSDFYLHWAGSVKILFDLNESPYLQNNLFDSLSEKSARMDHRLNSYIQMANYLSRGGRLD